MLLPVGGAKDEPLGCATGWLVAVFDIFSIVRKYFAIAMPYLRYGLDAGMFLSREGAEQ